LLVEFLPSEQHLIQARVVRIGHQRISPVGEHPTNPPRGVLRRTIETDSIGSSSEIGRGEPSEGFDRPHPSLTAMLDGTKRE
jgi:hypothetical protein